MEPSGWSVIFASILATLILCWLGSLAHNLERSIQILSGFVAFPLIALGAFSYWGSIRGTHNVGILLFVGWLVCIFIGAFISDRRAYKKKRLGR